MVTYNYIRTQKQWGEGGAWQEKHGREKVWARIQVAAWACVYKPISAEMELNSCMGWVMKNE